MSHNSQDISKLLQQVLVGFQSVPDHSGTLGIKSFFLKKRGETFDKA